MELREAIVGRRSIRSFHEKVVPTTKIEECLRHAIYAPNHKMTQPWRFVVLDREDQLSYQHVVDTKKAMKKGEPIPDRASITLKEDAPSHLIAVIMNVNESEKRYRDDIGATSSLIQNFSLLAWEEGIGVVWKTPTLLKDDDIRALLGVEEGEELMGILQIGYPKEIPAAKERKDLESILTYGLNQ